MRKNTKGPINCPVCNKFMHKEVINEHETNWSCSYCGSHWVELQRVFVPASKEEMKKSPREI